MNYKLIIALLLITFVGCIKDPDMEPYSVSDSQVFTLSIEAFSDEVIGSTRAEDVEDVWVDRGYILFYDNASGAYKGYKNIEALDLTQSGYEISFDVDDDDDYSTEDKIIAIFNYDESAEVPSDFSKVTSDNLSDYFPLSADYLADVEKEMNSGEEYSLRMPMFLNDFTDSDRATREVYRSMARIELFIKEGLTIEHDSHTHSIGAENLSFAIVNDISVGSVGVGTSTTESCFDLSSLEFPYSLTEYSDSAEDGQNKIYLYPYPYATQSIDGSLFDATTYSEERLSIILEHSDTNVDTGSAEPRYYKLNLLDKATSTYFDLDYNHSYRVVITAVNSRGYETLKEAYEMPPSNIEYEIYDDKGGLTYSNGQYAISMDEILSYDEILVYGSNETTLEFNNIRYVLPDGGQMDISDFDTNEIVFSVLSNSNPSSLNISTTSDFSFDNNNTSYLTSEGQSITVTLSGEGECSIQLSIKLGNLEMGRDEITIKKIATNGDGNGSFDAHPNHLEIADQAYVEGSWQSDDIDFGARASSEDYDDIGDGGTVIYMGENVTPTGYRTMDGYVSGQYSLNSYPVFSAKTRKGYYSYLDDDDETRKVMIQLEQLAPFYLGHFGSTSDDGSIYHYNGLICEKIEEIEIPATSWSSAVATGGTLPWAEAQKTYYQGVIWGDYLGLGDRYHNLVEGLAITQNIVENNTTTGSLPTAARYCYMKNDINGNEQIDSDEPIVWYLPAQNQALAMWINMNVFESDLEIYQLNMGEENPYYWTSSEVDDVYEYVYSTPSDFSTHVVKFNMLEGQADYENKAGSWATCHIRCVRGL